MNQLKRPVAQVNIVDGIVILVFSLYALLFFLGRWQGQRPFVFLFGDAANISGFTAAYDHPGNFIYDAILDNKANFRWYMTIHIPVLRALKPLFGDYGSAFIFQLGFHVFFQLAGFYILGRLIFKSRYWAFLLAAMTMATLWSPELGDYWGIFDDPQPRFTFQCLLPYLLSGVIIWRSNKAKWPLLMFAAGLLTYVHPVSAPAWGFATWLGLWFLLPQSWPLKKRLGFMTLMALIGLVTTIPFAVIYFTYRDMGKVDNYEQVFSLLKLTYGLYMDIPAAFTLYVKTYSVYLAIAFTGALIVSKLDRRNREIFLLTLLWLIGVLLVSVVLATLDHQISRAMRMIPVQTNLVRGIRFIAPFMILYWLWALVAISPYMKRFRYGQLMFAILASLGVIYLYREPLGSLLPRPRQALDCWLGGHWACIPSEESKRASQDMMGILEAVQKDTPTGTRILPMVNEEVNLAIRYYSLRPVVFTGKDIGVLAFTNTAQFLRWYEYKKEYDAINQEPPGPLKFREILEFANKVNAERVVIDNYPIPSEYLKEKMIIYQNQSYILIDVHP